MKKGTVIDVVNFKGGVGKTTSTLNIGYTLAREGYKVLLIDTDPQANLTASFGISKNLKQNTTYQLLLKESVNVTKVSDNIDIIPSCFDLAVWEEKQQFSKELILMHWLRSVKRPYDFILIDSPPSLGKLTQNGLCAADFVLIPVECEAYAIEGMGRLLDLIEQVKQHVNYDLKILGMFVTKFKENTVLHSTIYNKVKQQFSELLIDTPIRVNIKIAESIFNKEDVGVIAPESNGAKDYKELTNNIVTKIKNYG